MPTHSLPLAHIDLKRVCHNFNELRKITASCKADGHEPFAQANLPAHFGKNEHDDFNGIHFTWPEQLAVVKADAYGHGHIVVCKELIKHGVKMFASGSAQECLTLREHISNDHAILCLLGPLSNEDILHCQEKGIIPLIHSHEQLEMLNSATSTLPIAIKCNSGMARLGFELDDLEIISEKLCKMPNIMPVLALSHLHSADTEDVLNQITSQGTLFAKMLKILRKTWPNIAASLANSAGTIFADEIKKHIGPHISRPGIALYGCNPFYGTSHEKKINTLQTCMWVSAPILNTRKLKKGQGIGYGHSFIANADLDVAILGCGYADGLSRALSNNCQVLIDGKRAELIGRVSMQMIAVKLTTELNQSTKAAWILGGAHENSMHVNELAKSWGTITYEVLCALGNNQRKYINFDHAGK